jgi:hypothetical protein
MKQRNPNLVMQKITGKFLLEGPVITSRRRNDVVAWAQKGPPRTKSIYLLNIPHFSARGMQPIYGRGDHYPIRNNPELRKMFRWAENARTLICKMDMWQHKEGRILVRFHTRRRRLDRWSFELRGLKLPITRKRGGLLDEDCVPETLRDRYEEWVVDCLNYPNG